MVPGPTLELSTSGVAATWRHSVEDPRLLGSEVFCCKPPVALLDVFPRRTFPWCSWDREWASGVLVSRLRLGGRDAALLGCRNVEDAAWLVVIVGDFDSAPVPAGEMPVRGLVCASWAYPD